MSVGGGIPVGLTEQSDNRNSFSGQAAKHYAFFVSVFVSRKSGDLARVKTTISSPVVVLMSWCRLTTLTPAASWIKTSMVGRAVSIRWVRTCLSRSRPFSPERALTSCCSAAVRTP